MKHIESLPDIPFDEFYMNYILQIQDQNIDIEMDFLIHRNELNPMRMNKLINKSCERLVKDTWLK